MKSIFRNIRLAVSTLIHGDQAVNTLTAQVAAQLNQPHHSKVIAARKAQYAEPEEHQEVTKGYISTEDLGDFISDYSKNAIASLGAWSALAKGYNEFVKDQTSPKVESFLSEFHAWNAVSPSQMDEEAVLMTVARLAEVKPAKANETTDAILARIRKCTIEEVAAKRQADAEKKSRIREELLEAFVSAVWSHVYSEKMYQLPAAKVETKLIQTMEWVAGWDSTNPAAQAAELLLIEADLKMVKQLAKQDKHNHEDFVDGVLTADAMMRMNERKQA